MSSPERIEQLRRQQVRLVMQSTLFVGIGVILGWTFSGWNSVVIFIVNFGFALYTFSRAIRLRTQMHVVSTDRRVTNSDRLMAAAVALSLVLTGVFIVTATQQQAMQNRIDSVGRCWATDNKNSFAVDCNNPAATYRTTAVVDDKSECLVEYLERENGEFICTEPLT